jgi:hypothetical protein
VTGTTLRAVRSVFNDEKKLSIAALSLTLPDNRRCHHSQTS